MMNPTDTSAQPTVHSTPADTIITVEGWFALHDFRTFDWQAWNSLAREEKQHVQAEIETLTNQWQTIDERREGSFGAYNITGQKADVLFLHLRPALQDLTQVERELNTTAFARFLKPAYSYVSVVELSNYVVQHAGSVDHPDVQARLKLKLPKTNHVCFYPMNKRRGPGSGQIGTRFPLPIARV